MNRKTRQRYSYTYDALNRLTDANYTGTTGNYNTSHLSYDRNGNIKRLRRTTFDNLFYDYVGNQLTRVEDTGDRNALFQDVPSTVGTKETGVAPVNINANNDTLIKVDLLHACRFVTRAGFMSSLALFRGRFLLFGRLACLFRFAAHYDHQKQGGHQQSTDPGIGLYQFPGSFGIRYGNEAGSDVAFGALVLYFPPPFVGFFQHGDGFPTGNGPQHFLFIVRSSPQVYIGVDLVYPDIEQQESTECS